MIKFFRKIRYNLMSENKAEKYLKYAFGEILLVALGILIALQINNWNESRKEKNQLKIYYKQIILDLKEQKEYSKRLITQLDSSIASYEKYKKIFDTKSLTTNDVIEALNKVEFVSPYLSFRFNTMETLQSTGDIKIIPEYLRNRLITQKSKIDGWTTVNNGNLNIYLNGLLKFTEKGIGGLSTRLLGQPNLKKAIKNEIKPIEAILAAESAFGIKFFTESKIRERLKEGLKEIELIENLINSELEK